MKIDTLRNKYNFTRDDHSISLFRVTTIKDLESKNYGQESNVLIGHFSNVSDLLKKLFHVELIDKGTLNDLLEDCFKVKQNLDEISNQFGWR